MSLGLLFCGQGTQHPGMLPWLADDPLVQRTCESLGIEDWRAQLAVPAWSTRNHNAQVLLTGLGIAAWRQLQADVPAVGAIAGYSVGELAAYAAAGVIDDHAAVTLAGERARLMDQAAARSGFEGGLLSVSGARGAWDAMLASEPDVSIAIELDVDAAILGGRRDSLARIAAALEEQGASCKMLNVSVASHVAVMNDAAREFGIVLGSEEFKAPIAPLFCNFTGNRVKGVDEARNALSAQISSTVKWSACLEALHARRVSCVLELGPGAALSTMWRKRYPEVPARSVDEFRSRAAVVEWVGGSWG